MRDENIFQARLRLTVIAHVIRVLTIELLKPAGIAANPLLVGLRKKPCATNTFPNTGHGASFGHTEYQSDHVEVEMCRQRFSVALFVESFETTRSIPSWGPAPRHEGMDSPRTYEGEERELLEVRVYGPEQVMCLHVWG